MEIKINLDALKELEKAIFNTDDFELQSALMDFHLHIMRHNKEYVDSVLGDSDGENVETGDSGLVLHGVMKSVCHKCQHYAERQKRHKCLKCLMFQHRQTVL